MWYVLDAGSMGMADSSNPFSFVTRGSDMIVYANMSIKYHLIFTGALHCCQGQRGMQGRKWVSDQHLKSSKSC